MARISHYSASVAVILAGVGALGAAYYGEFVEHLVPCPLCYIERWPYRIIIVLGLLGMVLPRRIARVSLWLAAVTLFTDAGIALVHVGAERHWWQSPLPECNIAPAQFGALPLQPSASCDRPVFPVHGLPVSFATLDLLYALAAGAIISAYLIQTRGRR